MGDLVKKWVSAGAAVVCLAVAGLNGYLLVAGEGLAYWTPAVIVAALALAVSYTLSALDMRVRLVAGRNYIGVLHLSLAWRRHHVWRSRILIHGPTHGRAEEFEFVRPTTLALRPLDPKDYGDIIVVDPQPLDARKPSRAYSMSQLAAADMVVTTEGYVWKDRYNPAGFDPERLRFALKHGRDLSTPVTSS